MARNPGLRAGILHRVKYYDHIHAVAIELGHHLASYEMFFHGGDGSCKDFLRLRNQRKVMASIQHLLKPYNLRISDFLWLPEFDRQHSVQTILTQIKTQTDSATFTFLLIGHCSGFLRYAAASTGDEVRALQEVARRRLGEIEMQCSESSVACDALWEILVNRPREALDTPGIRKFITELQKPLKILMLSADPKNQDRLCLSQERRELDQALQTTRFGDEFQVCDLPSCRLRDIPRALDKYTPTVLHFSGHGNPNGLCFENEVQKTQIVDKDALADLFRGQSGLRLVVLNACYSQQQAQCIADSIGYVIAMEGRVDDQAAINFSREFYTALGDGRTFEAAFKRAVAAVHLEGTRQPKAHFLSGSPNNTQHLSTDRVGSRNSQRVDNSPKVNLHCLLLYCTLLVLISALALLCIAYIRLA